MYYVFIILQVNECFQHYIASLVSLLEMETQLFFIVNLQFWLWPHDGFHNRP